MLPPSCAAVPQSIVSIPAGLRRMPLPRFIVYTVIGSGVSNAAFIGAGWALDDNYDRVQGWVQPVGLLVLFALLAGIGLVAVRTVRERP